MSTLFISHASADATAARELASKLDDWGYGSLFLDFDADRGIHAGADWEEQLYRRLKLARAVVAVVSPSFVDSRWCFAEMTQARALGKPVFPLKVETCELGSLLEDRQAVDLTAGAKEAWERLRRGLDEVLGGDLPFDLEQPYPGLAAFEARDAGVFFGREEEQSAVIEALERMSRRGEPRLAVVLGASGCGKSSLVKAGVLPRLERDRERWLALPPMRPGGDPELALARVFAEAFAGTATPRGWRELADALAADAGRGHPWAALAQDLREAAGARQAAVLLAIDQLEELLAPVEGEEKARLAAFRRRLRAALEAPGSPLLAIATLRSDFLGVFQLSPELRDLPFEDLPLGPMPVGRMDRVIVGPAERAGVELEDDLVRRLVAETGTADALPLLAFTLRELWERRDGDQITLELYEERLGSIEGAVAQIAEGIAGDSDERELAALRSAFLRMARVDDEGRFVRRRASWDEIPETARPLVERFVDDHLLVSDTVDGERWIEVTHERIFKAWARLANWLGQEQELLLFRQRLAGARAEWERLGEDPSALLDGAALTEAERWSSERRDEHDRGERAFIERSLERRERLAAGARRRRRTVLAGLSAGLAVALILATLAGLQWQRAESQRREAVARQLATVALSHGTDTAKELVPRLLLATESLKSAWTHDGYGAWASAAAGLMRQPERRIEVESRVTGLAAHPTENRVAVADESDRVRVLDIDGGEVVAELEHHPAGHALDFSPDGRWLAAAQGHRVTVWETDGWSRVKEITGDGHTDDIAFSMDGELMAAAQHEVLLGPISTRTWRVPRPWPGDGDDYHLAVAFSPDASALATGGVGTLEFRRRDEGSSRWSEQSVTIELPRELQEHTWKLDWFDHGLWVWSGRYVARPYRPAFSVHAAELPFSFEDSTEDLRWHALSQATSPARFGALRSDLPWGARPESERALLLTDAWGFFPPSPSPADLAASGIAPVLARWAADDEFTAVEFSADGRWLVTGGGRLGLTDLRDIADAGATYRLGSEAATAVAFSPDGSSLAVCGNDQKLEIFELVSRRKTADIALSCDGVGFADTQRVVARGEEPDAAVRVVRRDGETWRPAATIRALPFNSTLSLSADGRWAAVWRPYSAAPRYRELITPSRTSIVDLANGEEVAWRTHEDEDIETFAREGWGSPDQPMKREEIILGWESDDATTLDGEPIELGEGGRTDLLDRSAGWSEVRFERPADSSDGRWRISERTGSSGWLLDPEGERQIVELVDGGVNQVAFSPDRGDGSEWVALATTGGLALWRLGPVEALVAETCARAPRNLEADEWPLDGPPPVTCPDR